MDPVITYLRRKELQTKYSQEIGERGSRRRTVDGEETNELFTI